MKTSGVRCGAEYNDWTIGAELTMDKITTPNFLLSPTPNLTIETDLSKFNIGYLLVSFFLNTQIIKEIYFKKFVESLLERPTELHNETKNYSKKNCILLLIETRMI